MKNNGAAAEQQAKRWTPSQTWQATGMPLRGGLPARPSSQLSPNQPAASDPIGAEIPGTLASSATGGFRSGSGNASDRIGAKIPRTLPIALAPRSILWHWRSSARIGFLRPNGGKVCPRLGQRRGNPEALGLWRASPLSSRRGAPWRAKAISDPFSRFAGLSSFPGIRAENH